MSLAIKYLPNYTVKDYESWQGDWELIEGIPYALACSFSNKPKRTSLWIADT